MDVLTWNPFRKRNEGALTGQAVCPFCLGNKVKLVEWVGPYVVRYRCKTCFGVYREDRTPKGHFGELNTKRGLVGDPYHSMKLPKMPGFPLGGYQIKKHHYKRD